MSQNELELKRAQLTSKEGSNSITVRVYTIFLSQPPLIGPCASRYVPLDLSDPEHETIFLLSVHSAVEELKSKFGSQSHKLIDKAFQEGWKIFSA